MPLFSVAAMLSKPAPFKTAYRLMNGYRCAANEDEAKGSYLQKIRDEYPDYALLDLLVLEVPEEVLRMGMVQRETEHT